MSIRPGRPGPLGKGLAALIPQAATSTPAPTEIPISSIEANPWQPRTGFEQESLAALAASIAEHGVIQPIVVTETIDGYRLIAGERRLRACKMAGLDRIPAVIRQAADADHLELALVENVQRADLNAIEEANAYRQLAEAFGLGHEEIARKVGRARSTVVNTLRLLDLDPAAIQSISEGRISEGHGRAMLGLDSMQQRELVALTEARGLSVRQVEELARRLREAAGTSQASGRAARVADTELERVEEDLRRALGTKVRMARSRNGGRIIIEWYGDEELGRLYEHLTGGRA
jgi:ParB family chromosome partitioning protein